MPDDFFRVRLVCVLLDTCGMCFDRGTQKKKLDNFLTFFQVPIVPFLYAVLLTQQNFPSIILTARKTFQWMLSSCYPTPSK